jgi:hypothetical protein
MKTFKKFGKIGAALALVVGAATAGVGIASSAMAQTGTPPAQSGQQQSAPQQDAPLGRGGPRGGGGPREGGLRGGQAITTTGTIAEYTINPMGDYDGFALADKTQIEVPLFDAVKVKDMFAVGSAVTVVGYQRTGRDGGTEIQAKTITSGSKSYTAEKPATPPTPAAREVVTQTSTIASLSLNDNGDLDGFALADKSLVRVPPHESATLKAKLTVGASVEVVGDKRVGTSGLTVIRAESIKVNGETVFTAPAGRGHGGPGGRGGRGPGGEMPNGPQNGGQRGPGGRGGQPPANNNSAPATP